MSRACPPGALRTSAAGVGSVGGMGRRWVPAVVLLGLLAGCGSSSTSGRGTPEAAAVSRSSAPPGLPVPEDPTQPPTTPPAPPSTTPVPPPTTLPPTTPAGRPCPADVAATLPGSPSATLVAGFQTSRFRLYFCQAAGRLYYRGISRADARQATTLPARTIPGGYEASAVVKGDAFVYRVAQGRLLVTKNGRQILADPVTATL